METYRGLPPPEVEVLMDYDPEPYDAQAEFLIASLHLCGNTGTYVDSPRHRTRGAADLSELRLESLADLAVTVIDASEEPHGIDADAIPDEDLRGRAVLFRTGFSRHWRTDRYFGNHPFLTAGAAARLVELGAALVGIDSYNIDDVGDLSRPVHTTLLRAGIPICEHMTNLAAIPPEGGRLHAVPIAWVGGASFPVRAYLVVGS
jgi:kynurenine formamidase